MVTSGLDPHMISGYGYDYSLCWFLVNLKVYATNPFLVLCELLFSVDLAILIK
jgi:hypothetical protein